MQDSSTARSGTPPIEPMLNFRSLAAMIGDEEDKDIGRESEHIEHATDPAEEELKEPSPTGSPRLSPVASAMEGNRSRGDSGESSSSAPPPIYVESPPGEDGDQITPAPQPQLIVGGHDDVDRKDITGVDIWDRGHAHEATQ